MRGAVGWTGKALGVVLLCVAYQYLVYAVVVDGQAGPVQLAVVLLPLLALACWIVSRSRNKPLWLAALVAAGAGVYVMYHQERLGLAAVSGLPHAAAYLFLLWYFGSTLARGREPIITRFARRVHGALQPAMELYTRRLTIAWCVFFAAQLIASALLYAFATLNAWSLFINLFNLPLLLLMFVGESIYRVVRHPDHPRASIAVAIQAFLKDGSFSKSA